MAPLICPYCFAATPRRALEFRCPGRVVGRTGGCEPVNDSVHAQFRGVPTYVAPPVFSADGRQPRAVHPVCGQLSLRRVCPTCHTELPSDYCDVPSRLVALVGAKNSGKSTFIGVLIHELRNRLGRELRASLNACDDRTATRYHNDFEQLLYGQGVLPPITQTAAHGLHDPLVYRLTLPARTRFFIPGSGRSSTRESLALVLFDTAGEDLTSEASVDSHLRYLGVADAIMFLVDPLELPSVRRTGVTGTNVLAGASPPPQPPAAFPDDPLDVIRRVTTLVRASRGVRAPKRLPVEVALCLTKIDAVDLGISEQSPLRGERRRDGGLDLTDRGLVGEELRALLAHWGGDALERELADSYESYGVFGVSALGHPPIGGAVGAAGVTPRRVEDPLLWLLYRFKMVDAGKG
jgi:hypothetical protein